MIQQKTPLDRISFETDKYKYGALNGRRMGKSTQCRK